jgi:hypothetical protein
MLVTWNIYIISVNPKMEFGKIDYMTKHLSLLLITILLLVIDISIILTRFKSKNSLKISFPLKNGRYIIIDGGDGKKSFLGNYHYYFWKKNDSDNYKSMRYAVDIIKIDKYGFAHKSIIPSDNRDFNVFDEKVFSPINGEVVYTVTNDEDNNPFIIPSNNSVNYIIIKNDNYYIFLMHFKKDSIAVKVGQMVLAGDYLGDVGNSGYSPWPHLHIHAALCINNDYWYGEGVPVLFDNQNPVKNRLFVRKG